MNPFQERKNDVNPNSRTKPNKFQDAKEPLRVQEGPITRSKSKKLQEALFGLIQGIWKAQEHSNPFKINEESKVAQIVLFTTSIQVNLEGHLYN